jgi:hypothetical protein
MTHYFIPPKLEDKKETKKKKWSTLILLLLNQAKIDRQIRQQNNQK